MEIEFDHGGGLAIADDGLVALDGAQDRQRGDLDSPRQHAQIEQPALCREQLVAGLPADEHLLDGRVLFVKRETLVGIHQDQAPFRRLDLILGREQAGEIIRLHQPLDIELLALEQPGGGKHPADAGRVGLEFGEEPAQLAADAVRIPCGQLHHLLHVHGGTPEPGQPGQQHTEGIELDDYSTAGSAQRHDGRRLEKAGDELRSCTVQLDRPVKGRRKNKKTCTPVVANADAFCRLARPSDSIGKPLRNGIGRGQCRERGLAEIQVIINGPVAPTFVHHVGDQRTVYYGGVAGAAVHLERTIGNVNDAVKRRRSLQLRSVSAAIGVRTSK